MDVDNAAAPPQKKLTAFWRGSQGECGSSTLVNDKLADTGDGIAGADGQAERLTLSRLGNRLRSLDRPSGLSTTYTLLDGTALASS